MDGLKFMKHSSWEEVFQKWKEDEGSIKAWQDFAVREKGWGSWEEWRQHQASFIDAQNRKWDIYEILDPNKIIPNFRIGPFKSWQDNYSEAEKNIHTFRDLVRDKTEWVMGNSGIKSMKDNFPPNSQFIGIYVEEDDIVVLFEGHHRVAATALSDFVGSPFEFEILPTIAMTSIRCLDKKYLDELLNKETRKM